jgi:hypothetical protein
VARTLDADPAAAKRTLQQAAAAKIDLARVTAELEGVQIARDSYRELTGKYVQAATASCSVTRCPSASSWAIRRRRGAAARAAPDRDRGVLRAQLPVRCVQIVDV